MLRVAIAGGLALFLWSVSASMERIARALTRLADAAEAKRDRTTDGPPPDRPA
jgi:hypothetical protein